MSTVLRSTVPIYTIPTLSSTYSAEYSRSNSSPLSCTNFGALLMYEQYCLPSLVPCLPITPLSPYHPITVSVRQQRGGEGGWTFPGGLAHFSLRLLVLTDGDFTFRSTPFIHASMLPCVHVVLRRRPRFQRLSRAVKKELLWYRHK